MDTMWCRGSVSHIEPISWIQWGLGVIRCVPYIIVCIKSDVVFNDCLYPISQWLIVRCKKHAQHTQINKTWCCKCGMIFLLNYFHHCCFLSTYLQATEIRGSSLQIFVPPPNIIFPIENGRECALFTKLIRGSRAWGTERQGMGKELTCILFLVLIFTCCRVTMVP